MFMSRAFQRGRIIEGNDSNSFCLFQSDHFVIHENLLIFLKQTYVIFIITLKIKDCRDVSAQEAYIIESKEVITKTEKIEIGQYTVKLYIS